MGTSQTITHSELANIVLSVFLENNKPLSVIPSIQLIDMPQSMKKVFQFYTKAMDIHPLIHQGLTNNRERIKEYIKNLCSVDL